MKHQEFRLIDTTGENFRVCENGGRTEGHSLGRKERPRVLPHVLLALLLLFILLFSNVVIGYADEPDLQDATYVAYFKEWSLSVGDGIAINLYFDCDNCENVSSLCGVVNGQEFELKDSNIQTENGGTLKFITYPTAPKNLGDILDIGIRAKNDEFVVTTRNVYENFSVRKCLEKVIADEVSTTEEMRAFCRALDNYGQAAQVYFGYDADNAAPKMISLSENRSEYDRLIESKSVSTGLKYSGSTLVLGDKISVRHYFEIMSGHSVSQYKFFYKGEELSPKDAGDSFYVECPNISVCDYGNMYSLNVKNLDGTFNWNICYSPLSYANRILDGASEDENLKVLCSALYDYNSAWTTILGQIYPKAVCRHLEMELDYVVNPTCSQNGYQIYKCLNCGASIKMSKRAMDSQKHSFELRDVITEATCKENGSGLYICTGCGQEKTDAIVGEHDYQYKKGKEPTCTATGLKTYECTICGERYHENLPEKGHEYEWVVTKAATATEEGLKEYICKICKDVSDSDPIPVLNCKHSHYTWTVVQEPTCVKTKLKRATCDDCGYIILDNYDTKTLDPDVHEHLTETIVEEASYSSSGTRKYTCTDCNKSYTEDIPKLVCQHRRTGLSVDDEANWWSICSDCGKILGPSSYTTDNCAHAGYGRYRELVQQVGENQDGIWEYHCANCQQVVSRETRPGYQIYTVDLGNGETAEVYGYYLTDVPNEVWRMTNEYRLENGLNSLNYATNLQDECDLRALEASYKFDHERPNGQIYYLLNQTYMSAENLAMGYKTASTVMTAWKNSTGHNENLLHPVLKSLAVSTFVKYELPDGEGFPVETYVSCQTFSCYSKPE